MMVSIAVVALATVTTQMPVQRSVERIRACAGLDDRDRELAADLEASVQKLRQERLALETERKALEQAMDDLIAVASAVDADNKQEAPPPQPVAKTEEQAAEESKNAIPPDPGKLVKIVEGMKPEVAAALLEELDEELAKAVVRKMKPGKAARLLSTIEPRRAAVLAEAVVNRNQGATP